MPKFLLLCAAICEIMAGESDACRFHSADMLVKNGLEVL